MDRGEMLERLKALPQDHTVFLTFQIKGKEDLHIGTVGDMVLALEEDPKLVFEGGEEAIRRLEQQVRWNVGNR